MGDMQTDGEHGFDELLLSCCIRQHQPRYRWHWLAGEQTETLDDESGFLHSERTLTTKPRLITPL